MSRKCGDSSFLAMAPYYAHSVTRNTRQCSDCHNSATVREYAANGTIQVTGWGGTALTHIEGVVPVPADWRRALLFDFVDWDGGEWSFMEAGPDKFQMLFAEPLTQEQMGKLGGEYG